MNALKAAQGGLPVSVSCLDLENLPLVIQVACAGIAVTNRKPQANHIEPKPRIRQCNTNPDRRVYVRCGARRTVRMRIIDARIPESGIAADKHPVSY